MSVQSPWGLKNPKTPWNINLLHEVNLTKPTFFNKYMYLKVKCVICSMLKCFLSQINTQRPTNGVSLGAGLSVCPANGRWRKDQWWEDTEKRGQGFELNYFILLKETNYDIRYHAHHRRGVFNMNCISNVFLNKSIKKKKTASRHWAGSVR